jgi:uncharacterized FlgJ-related protein
VDDHQFGYITKLRKKQKTCSLKECLSPDQHLFWMQNFAKIRKIEIKRGYYCVTIFPFISENFAKFRKKRVVLKKQFTTSGLN